MDSSLLVISLWIGVELTQKMYYESDIWPGGKDNVQESFNELTIRDLHHGLDMFLVVYKRTVDICFSPSSVPSISRSSLAAKSNTIF